ncbi:MAG: alpha/beta fold hydrolase [Acidobacteriota bacterium]
MIWCLHGFLGQGSDWDQVRPSLREAGLESCAPSLFSGREEILPIERWAEQFTALVRRQDSEPVLLGYSMGGRLALHALLGAPSMFRAAVIVSAGLGTEGEQKREDRRERDEQWARDFENDPWEELLERWNDLDVFGGSPVAFDRREEEFDRGSLAGAMRLWSPARQEFLLAKLSGLDVPVLWLAGENDERYVAEGRRAVAALDRGQLKVIPGAGHRVPWENPRGFLAEVLPFLRRP